MATSSQYNETPEEAALRAAEARRRNERRSSAQPSTQQKGSAARRNLFDLLGDIALKDTPDPSDPRNQESPRRAPPRDGSQGRLRDHIDDLNAMVRDRQRAQHEQKQAQKDGVTVEDNQLDPNKVLTPAQRALFGKAARAVGADRLINRMHADTQRRVNKATSDWAPPTNQLSDADRGKPASPPRPVKPPTIPSDARDATLIGQTQRHARELDQRNPQGKGWRNNLRALGGTALAGGVETGTQTLSPPNQQAQNKAAIIQNQNAQRLRQSSAKQDDGTQNIRRINTASSSSFTPSFVTEVVVDRLLPIVEASTGVGMVFALYHLGGRVVNRFFFKGTLNILPGTLPPGAYEVDPSLERGDRMDQAAFAILIAIGAVSYMMLFIYLLPFLLPIIVAAMGATYINDLFGSAVGGILSGWNL